MSTNLPISNQISFIYICIYSVFHSPYIYICIYVCCIYIKNISGGMVINIIIYIYIHVFSVFLPQLLLHKSWCRWSSPFCLFEVSPSNHKKSNKKQIVGGDTWYKVYVCIYIIYTCIQLYIYIYTYSHYTAIVPPKNENDHQPTRQYLKDCPLLISSMAGKSWHLQWIVP